MRRADLSDDLIHLVKGDTPLEAFETLKKILHDRRLLGGNGFIKGGYTCVCFCEAPITPIAAALSARARLGIRYQPFGIVIPKTWAYYWGGRPVIYQSDAEFSLLGPGNAWRHVRYEPNADPPIDFTWEREWRVPTTEIGLDPAVARVLVPKRDYLQHLISEHEATQDYQYQMYSLIMDEMLAWQYREAFPWQVVVLEDLGIPFSEA